MTPRVRVVVVNYNGRELTLRCLDSLAAVEWPPERLEVVLVDNGSSDGTVDAVRGRHRDVRVLEPGRNLGFAAANNLALADLGGVDYVALVNNDAIVERNWLQPLVAALEADSAAGAACPKILFDETSPSVVIYNVGSIAKADGHGGDRGFLELDAGQYDERAEVFGWCGCSVLLRTAYLEDVGLLDPRLFLYYEDFDLSWRGRARGWRYLYVPDSVVRHAWAATAGRGSPLVGHYVDRNRLLVHAKNAPARYAAYVILRYVAATVWYAATDPRRGARRVLTFFDFLRNLAPVLLERRRIRSARRVPDEEVMRWVQGRAATPPVESAKP